MRIEIIIILLLVLLYLIVRAQSNGFTPVALMPTMYQATEPRGVRFSNLRQELYYNPDDGRTVEERYGNT